MPCPPLPVGRHGQAEALQSVGLSARGLEWVWVDVKGRARRASDLEGAAVLGAQRRSATQVTGLGAAERIAAGSRKTAGPAGRGSQFVDDQSIEVLGAVFPAEEDSAQLGHGRWAEDLAHALDVDVAEIAGGDSGGDPGGQQGTRGGTRHEME